MCIRDRHQRPVGAVAAVGERLTDRPQPGVGSKHERQCSGPVSYTHLRAHETVLDLVCRLLLEKKKQRHNTHMIDETITQNIYETQT